MADDPLEAWEREVLAGHRWGAVGQDVAARELARLREFSNAAGPMDADHHAVIAQVVGPELCNWALLETIERVCSIIGREKPDSQGTGHAATLTPERLHRIWAYYLSCRRWLVEGDSPRSSYRTGHAAMLNMVDAAGTLQQHVAQLLGARDGIKEMFVERFCICLEAWLEDLPQQGRASRLSLDAAARALEQEILRHEPQPRVPFEMIRLDDHSILQACHHKLFRRYDIILSSIGDGRWRKSIPTRGTDGEDRAREVQSHLSALEEWVSAAGEPMPAALPAADLHKRLGSPNDFKRFAVALLASLLRSQQSAALQKAARRRAGG